MGWNHPLIDLLTTPGDRVLPQMVGRVTQMASSSRSKLRRGRSVVFVVETHLPRGRAKDVRR